MSRDRAPTQRDVAELAGVSTATVSYILSGRRDRPAPVTPATRERVLAAVAELGYHRNHVARSLRRQRTELVCLVYRMPDNPWLERLVEQLHDAAARRGYSVIALPLRGGAPTGPALRVLGERSVDGAVVAPGAYLPPDQMRRLATAGLAVTVFDDDLEPDGFDVVDQAQDAACRALVDHLVEGGHRRIAYLGHEADLRGGGAPLAAKYRSVAAALAEHGLALEPGMTVAGADSRADAYTATRRLLLRTRPPTALLSASDRGAMAAVTAARDLGVSVPDMLAVAGMGNAPESAVISPTLTTVGIDRLDFSPVVGRLFDRIEATERPPGTRLSLPWRLIVRESTRTIR